jgi:hypothetical protein
MVININFVFILYFIILFLLFYFLFNYNFILDGVLKNNILFDYVELVVEDNHIIEQKRFSGENTVSIFFYYTFLDLFYV